MAKLVYSAIAALDGYVADEEGNFDWAEPDEEVHAFINDLDRPLGTYLHGRRMYETMVGWETYPTLADRSPLMRDFAELWQAAEKIVYSGTLEVVSTTRTRIERAFDPEADRKMKALVGRDMIVAVPPQRSPREARTAGRTPFRQRHGLTPLPHQDLKRRRRCLCPQEARGLASFLPGLAADIRCALE